MTLLTHALGVIEISLVIHELGHAGMAVALGHRVRPKLSRYGLGVRWGEDDVEAPRDDRVRVAMAGPLASLLLVVLATDPLLMSASAMLALVNLLPLPRSDWRHVVDALQT